MGVLEQVLLGGEEEMYTSRKLEVILKLVEVCNIACTYCYYFTSDDQRHADRPGKMPVTTVESLVSFVNTCFDELRIDSVQINLHGGEPLMLGKKRFDEVCSLLRRIHGPTKICVTTNAMLLDAEWAELLRRSSINVCVSLDGPSEIHDRRRIDKRGRATYGRVMRGLAALSDAGVRAAVLCVIDPSSDPAVIYQHLVRDLGFRHLDFLLPDVTYETAACAAPEQMAEYVLTLMRLWLKEDDPTIHIRTFKSVLSLLAGGSSYLSGFGTEPALVMTVGSDGSIDTDDFLKPCGAEIIATKANIDSATFDDVFLCANTLSVRAELARIPADCIDCEFSSVCRGGQATHRFSAKRGFDNRSVYCKAQYELFREGALHLISTSGETEAVSRVLLEPIRKEVESGESVVIPCPS